MQSRLNLLMILTISILFASCKKNNDVQTKSTSDKNLIKQAKSFFEMDVQNGSSTSGNSNFNDKPFRIGKRPIWENAVVGKFGERSSAVMVPLNLEKDFTFKTTISGDSTLSLEKQTILAIYKDYLGKFKAEVLTYIPDKNDRNTGDRFSGIVSVNEWSGKNIENFLYKGGKKYKLGSNDNETSRSSQVNASSIENCITIHWYLCDVDQWNNTSNCEFLYSEKVGSGCNEGLQEPGEGGGYYDEILYAPADIIANLTGDDQPLYTSSNGEYFDPSNGKKKKNQTYSWNCGRNTFLSWSWNYKSFESAVLVEEGGIWKFEEVSHNNILFEGTTPPYATVSHTLGYAVPNILYDGTWANMALSYQVTVRSDKLGSGATANRIINQTSRPWKAQ